MPGAFQLEDPQGVALGQQVVGLGVVQGDAVDVGLDGRCPPRSA